MLCNIETFNMHIQNPQTKHAASVASEQQEY